jgi:hypothetical protein
MKGLDPATHNFWKSGVATDLCYRDPGISKSFCGRSSGKNLNSGVGENLTEFKEAVFIVDA